MRSKLTSLQSLDQFSIIRLTWPSVFFSVFFCSIALFSSEEKGKLFVPSAEERNCVVVSSKTGKLIDIDVQAVKNALPIFSASFALV